VFRGARHVEDVIGKISGTHGLSMAHVYSMSENPAAEYADLLRRYHELVEAVHMVRRAAERAARVNALPAIEADQAGSTPLQECEAVARALYAAAGRQRQQGASVLAGISRDKFSV
jgi:hypothetical protein